MQPTPLCGPKIGAILKPGFGPSAFPIYWCGAADGQAVGRLLLVESASSLEHVLMTHVFDTSEQFATTNTLVTHVVAETFHCDVLGITPILGSGLINAVFRVDTTMAPLIVRLNQLDHLATYRKEQWCLRQAHQHGIPVPTVLAVGSAADVAFMIQTYIPGTSGAAAEIDAGHIWFRLGIYAARANQIAVVGYGGVMEPGQPGVFTATWKHMLDDLVMIVFRDDYWTQPSQLTASQHRQLERWIAHVATFESPIGLCHTDIGPRNTILHHGVIDDLYLLDWEMAEAAPVPAYQLASVARYWGYRSVAMHQFVHGYREEVPNIDLNDTVVKGLTALGALAIVRWAQDHQPEAVASYTRSAQTIIRDLTKGRDK
jgi:Ser/Thr protein kinase RdoA (MazF antagonist)